MTIKRHKADTELVRRQNRSLVLEALRRNGTLASIELGEKTQLSPATISAITNDLLAERLIETDREETEKHRSVQRGRPKVKLRLAASAALVLAIRLTHNAIYLLLADFCGTVRSRKTLETQTAKMSAAEIGATLVAKATSFLADQNITGESLSLISVACQGSVDANRGEIIWSPAYKARNIPIADPLHATFDTPCIVANDTNAIAHLLHVEDENLKGSFAVLYLGSGIGLGLYVNGDLIEGADGSASEFGHMLWQPDGALCRCGRQGCLEAYASDFGIMRASNPALMDKDPNAITPSMEEMTALADRARDGDKPAHMAFEQAGAAIGTGLGNLIMLINPHHVLFTGPGMAYFDLMRPGLEDALTHAASNGHKPQMTRIEDNRDLIEEGMLALAYTRLDRDIFTRRVSVQDVAARQRLLGA